MLRHQIIEDLLGQQRSGDAEDAAIRLWTQMAAQIISIVGEGGFNSLFARSIFLTQAIFPWLAIPLPSPQSRDRFAELKASLEGQLPAQACAANTHLLITFTDILASLIGEELTIRILRSAWSVEISHRAAGKEQRHEQ